MLDIITSTISNKMRQPIDLIMQRIETLETSVANNIKLQSISSCIKNSTQFLHYLVNDMLDIHMIKSGKFKQNE